MLKPVAWANSLAAVTVIFYLVLWILNNVAPDLFSLVFNAQFLGADVASLTSGWDIQTGVVNLVVLAVSVWIMGYIWAYLYNRFTKG